MALLSKTPRKQAPLNIYLRVLTIRIHPKAPAFMRTAEVLQGRLGKRKVVPKVTLAQQSVNAKLNSKFPRCAVRAIYKGKTYRAIFKADASILYEGTEYKTPSGAAQAVVGRNANGWTFWNYKNGADWIPISNLRN